MTDRNLHFLYSAVDKGIGSVINFDNVFKEHTSSAVDVYVVEAVTPSGFTPVTIPTASYDKGQKVSFTVTHACTGGAATLAISGLTAGAKSIKTVDDDDPAVSDMPLNSLVDLIYSGTAWIIEKTILQEAGAQVINITAATGDVDTNKAIYHVSYTATGAVTLTIKTAFITVANNTCTIKDGGLSAGTNNITINTEGSETIDGETSFELIADGEAIDIYTFGGNIYVRGVS